MNQRAEGQENYEAGMGTRVNVKRPLMGRINVMRWLRDRVNVRMDWAKGQFEDDR